MATLPKPSGEMPNHHSLLFGRTSSNHSLLNLIYASLEVGLFYVLGRTGLLEQTMLLEVVKLFTTQQVI